MINSGILNILIEMSLSLNDPRNATNVSYGEKIEALTFLVDIWICKPLTVQASNHGDGII